MKARLVSIVAASLAASAAYAAPGEIRLERPAGTQFRYHPGLSEPLYRAVKDPRAWASLWSQMTARTGSMPPLPRVDFQRHMLLLAAMGSQPMGGYSVEIVSVRDAGPHLLATAVRTTPGPRCGGIAAITYPTDMVLVPRSSKPVRWSLRDTVRHCP